MVDFVLKMNRKIDQFWVQNDHISKLKIGKRIFFHVYMTTIEVLIKFCQIWLKKMFWYGASFPTPPPNCAPGLRESRDWGPGLKTLVSLVSVWIRFAKKTLKSFAYMRSHTSKSNIYKINHVTKTISRTKKKLTN